MTDVQCAASLNSSVIAVLKWLLIAYDVANDLNGDPYATFIDPAGYAFTLKIESQFRIVSAIHNGPLLSFIYNNGLVYKANISSGVFLGYFNDKEGRFEDYLSNPEQLPGDYGLYALRKDGSFAKICYIRTSYKIENRTFYERYSTTNIYTKIPESYSGKKPLILPELYKQNPNCSYNENVNIRPASTVMVEDEFIFGIEKVKRYTFNVPTANDLVKKYEKVKPIENTTTSFVENGFIITYDKVTQKWIARTITQQELDDLKRNIEDGNIKSESEVLFETQTRNGITTVGIGALGYRNDLTPKNLEYNWNDEIRTKVQTEQKKKINDKLFEKRVTDITSNTGGGRSSNKFPDDVETIIKDLSWFETITKVTKETSAFIQDCQIPERMYNPQAKGYNDCIINTSPYFSGVGNGVIDEVKSIPQLIMLATDIVLDENTRNGIVQSFSELTLEKIYDGIANTVTEIKDDITTNSVKGNYNKGTYTVTVVSMVFAGGVKKLGELLDQADNGLAKNLDNVGEKMDEIAVKKIDDAIDWALVKKYFNYIQEVTGLPVMQKQIDRITDVLRSQKFTKLSKTDYENHSKLFTKSKKDALIKVKEWEIETGQKWPVYETDILDKNGNVFRRKGDPYDAHHIIEQNYGGPHEWWNMHPARAPDQHQGGIHGAGSPARELFK